MVSDTGIQQITIRAAFEGLDGAVVFDDFDATVSERDSGSPLPAR